MPVIKSAKKKLRKDKKRTEKNRVVKNLLKSLIKKAKKTKSIKDITNAVSMSDKMAKKHIIHNNKAARIKSQLSKLSLPSSQKKPSLPIRKTSRKKK